MKNNLMIFEGNKVEVILGENGEPLFELYTTGMALGFVRPNSTGKMYPRKDRIDKCLENAEISMCVHDGHKYLTEEQLYDFMLEARTDKCKAFRKWVTHEVLPQIRKTGGYIPTNEEDDDLTIMSKAFLIANKTIEEKEKIIKEKDITINIMKSENEQLKNELEELEEYKTFKHMINSVDTKDMQLGQFGQWLKSNTNIKTGQKLIFKWCKENNLVKYEYKENYAKDYAINNGWLKNVCEYVDTPYGVIPTNKIFVTHKGMLYLGKRLFEEYLNVSI